MARSIDDWVKIAAEASGPDERAAALASAEALARSAWDWRRLLREAGRRRAGDAAWRERAADRLLVAAIAEQDVGGVRTVAEARAQAGNLAAAREALEVCAASLDVAGRAYTWTSLARGFAEILGDTEAARACIDRNRAPGLEERSEIARARAELLGERDEAKALLAALTPSDAYEAWTLGNAWQSVGEPARALDVFAAALATANALREVLTLARAWASHGDAVGRDRALDVAEGRAGSAADWLDIADVAHDLTLPERLRAALLRVESLPLSDATRPRAAAAWLWLGETSRAEALGPRGVRPGASTPILRDLPGFTPSATALFDDLRARLTEASLQDLAGADYGNGYDAHLVALRDLVRTGRVPRPLPWEPGEVVRLRRWSDGDSVDHVQRGFCCALLCIDGDDGHNDPPVLVESAVALGPVESAEAEALLAWMYATAGEDALEDRLAASWALALLCAARNPEDPRIHELAARAEQVIRAGASAEGILRYCVRKELWIELSARWFGAAGPTAAWRAMVGLG